MAVGNAYGDFWLIGSFKLKRDAVLAIQMLLGTDQRPNKHGEIGNHLVTTRESAAFNFGLKLFR